MQPPAAPGRARWRRHVTAAGATLLLAACAGTPPSAPPAALPPLGPAAVPPPVPTVAPAAASATVPDDPAPASTGATDVTDVTDGPAQSPSPSPPEAGEVAAVERGLASWYGARFHGRRTASGERFDMHALTAAHRTLPFGTRVQVRNPGNGRVVVVRITDRGPARRDRVIDLSRAAARWLGIDGLATVELRPLPGDAAAGTGERAD